MTATGSLILEQPTLLAADSTLSGKGEPTYHKPKCTTQKMCTALTLSVPSGKWFGRLVLFVFFPTFICVFMLYNIWVKALAAILEPVQRISSGLGLIRAHKH